MLDAVPLGAREGHAENVGVHAAKQTKRLLDTLLLLCGLLEANLKLYQDACCFELLCRCRRRLEVMRAHVIGGCPLRDVLAPFDVIPTGTHVVHKLCNQIEARLYGVGASPVLQAPWPVRSGRCTTSRCLLVGAGDPPAGSSR
jgi:hypothetical protein